MNQFNDNWGEYQPCSEYTINDFTNDQISELWSIRTWILKQMSLKAVDRDPSFDFDFHTNSVLDDLNKILVR